MTAPGLGFIWDKTAIEARTDPTQDQSKFGTTLSKSLPLWSDQYSLTLQNGYNVTQQALVPVFGLGHTVRSLRTRPVRQGQLCWDRHQPHCRADPFDHR